MTQENRVVASTRLIAALTMVSRVLGLGREIVFAHFFGTTPLLSSFRIAFMIPNLARRLFGEGALSAAFIPVFSRTLHEQDHDYARRLAGSVLTLLSAVLMGLVVLGEIGILVAYLIQPSLTLELTALMLPFMGFICVAAFLGGILNVLGQFGAPAIVPTLLNGIVIIAILAGAYLHVTPLGLVYLESVAVVVAGVAQVALQVYSLRRAGFVPILNRVWKRPEIRQITAFMGPMILGLSVVQVATTLDMVVAQYFVADGQGPAVLGYAIFLYQLPLGVFGIALATAIFPVLAERAAEDDNAGLVRTLERGGRMSFFISLHATIGLILISRPLVAVLFQRGAFGPSGTERVAITTTFYTIGLCSYSFQHILVRTMYAIRRHGAAARIGAYMVMVNLILNLILVKPLGEAGVALATAIGAMVQNAWLFAVLRRHLPDLNLRSLHSSALKTAISATVMGAFVYVVVNDMIPLRALHWRPPIKIAVAVAIGGGVTVAMGRLLRIKEASELLQRAR